MRGRSRLWPLLGACVVAVCALSSARADRGSARVYMQAGDDLAAQWRYRDALAMYAMAGRFAEGPERIEASLGVSFAALRLGDFERAYAVANELRQAHGDYPRVVTAYGEAAWANGEFDEAEAAFGDALVRDPADSRARLGLARVLVGRHRLAEALDNALAAARSAPDESDAHYLCAAVYERLGKPEAAAGFYSRYLALVPPLAADKRAWVSAQIELLRSFDRTAPDPAGDDPDAAPLYRVPFRFIDDKIVVELRVNGGPPIDFHLDTGAETTLVAAGTASQNDVAVIAPTMGAGIGELGLHRLRNGRLDSLQIGPLVVRDVACLIDSAAGDQTLTARNVFSPLSLDLSVEIDYTRQELTIGKVLPEERHDVEMPLWLYRLATVRGVVGEGRPGRFVVDTGAKAISIASELGQAASAASAARRLPLAVVGTSGADRDAYLLIGGDLALGPIVLRKVPLVVLNLKTPSERLGYRIAGIVGNHFLSRYRVSFDVNRGVLGLDRRP